MSANTRFPSSLWLWGGFIGLLAIMAVRFYLLSERQVVAPEPLSPVATASLFPASEAANLFFIGPRPESEMGWVFADTLRYNETITLSLRRHHLAEGQLAQLVRAFSQVYNCKSGLRPGDSYTLTLDPTGAVQRFEYLPWREPDRPVLIESIDGRLVGRRLLLPLTTRTEVVEFRIEDNLYNAVRDAGEGDELTDILADDILAAVVDFQRDPRQGDRLGVVFEKLYKDDHFIRYGRVLLARYEGEKVSQLAVYYGDSSGERGYYDATGKSLERAFLLYALPYRGITSRFSQRRFHPILKRLLPHRGTDYAAKMGTPVWATARGRVVHAGWKGALGKAVIVEHANGYVTRYGHLSKVLVEKGQYVQQKELIGLVGATGRTTGPHLHYEILKDGRHLNPENINKGARGRALSANHLAAFYAHRDSLLNLLEEGIRRLQPLATAAPEDSSGLGDSLQRLPTQ